jgi:hypothetical protein
VFACGGDDDGGDVTIADGGGTEADAGAGGDGGTATAENLGRSCSEENQCPNEAEGCLGPANAETGFCSLLCEGTEDTTTCSNGYPGPGLAVCFISLQSPDGTPTGDFACGVICEAPDEMCPADVCDGTCPGDLECTVSAGSPEVSICQPPGTGGGTDAGTGTDASVGPSGIRAIGVSQAALRMLRARR